MELNKLKKAFAPILKNKYLLTLFIFIVWIGVFDRDNLLDRFSSIRELKQIEQEKQEYRARIEEDTESLEKLENPEYLERFAREEHKMKKDNEDLFIVEED